MPGEGSSAAGFALQTAQRGPIPGEAPTGGAQRPPEGRLQSAQVSCEHNTWRILSGRGLTMLTHRRK